jgi:hypothetical protein
MVFGFSDFKIKKKDEKNKREDAGECHALDLAVGARPCRFV